MATETREEVPIVQDGQQTIAEPSRRWKGSKSRDNQTAPPVTDGETLRLKLETLEFGYDHLEERLEAALERVDLLETREDPGTIGLKTLLHGLQDATKELEDQERNEAIRIDVPKPAPFKGNRDAKEVDSFLWQVEQYLDHQNVRDENTRIRTAALYLADNAGLWWRRKAADLARGVITMDTWVDFVREFKKQFYPANAVNEARAKLRVHRHNKSIREYVETYTALILQIPGISDDEALFQFTDGLTGWAKTEVLRRNPATLDEAIAYVESLPEKTPEQYPKPKDKGKERMHSPPRNYDRQKSPNSRLNERKKPLRCFVCQGDHKFSNCPKYGKLSAMFSRNNDEPIEDPSDEEDDALQMSSLKVLGAISHPSSTTDLLYVDVVINGKKSRALIDTGATHNFIEEAEATRLKLRTESRRQLIKTVNQRPQLTVGIAKDVTVRVGPWKGRVSFTVTAMDDYKIVLGMDAMKQHHIVPLPHHRSISIQQSDHPLIIPAVPPSVMKINRLSAMAKSGESEVRGPFHGAPRSKVRPYEGLAVKDIKKIRQQMKGKPTKLTLKFGGEPILQILL
nr:uncharacterized protein LOC105969880 [Ipomoea trifida]